MTMPEDVYANTSGELCTVIAGVLEDENVAQPATLESVREAILAEVKTITIPLNRFSSDQWQQLREEIDALIDAHGVDALAVRFLRPWASESLSRLIEAGLDELGEPTLRGLFEASEKGLLANLIGKGEIDADEAQSVIAELTHFIDHHGPDALAEDLLGTP